MSHGGSSTSWLSAVRIDEALLADDDLARTDDLTTFVGDLVGVYAGRRSRVDAVQEFIEQRRFDRAARCVEGAPDVDRAPLDEAIRNAWGPLFAAWKHRENQAAAALPGLEDIGVDVAPLQTELRALQALLAGLPDWTDPSLLVQLRRVSASECRKLQEQADLVEISLEYARGEVEQRARAREEKLFELKVKGDSLGTDMLRNRALAPEIRRRVPDFQAALASAVIDVDLQRATRIVEAIERLKAGESSPDDESVLAQRATARSVPPAQLQPQADEDAPFDERSLSRLSQKEVVGPLKESPLVEVVAPSEGDALWLEVTREWSPPQIESVRLRAGSLPRKEALGAQLLLMARLALIGNLPERAQLFFLDALRWSMAEGVSERPLGRFRDAAAWGLLYTVSALHIPPDQRVLEPERLDTESRDLNDTLDRIVRMDLFSEVAAVLLDLGRPSVPFYERYLATTISANRRTGRALVVGLVENLTRDPLSAGRLLDAVLRSDGVSSVALDEAALSGEPPRETAAFRAWLSPRLGALKGWLVGLREESALADEAISAIESVEKRLDRGSQEAHVALSLLTPELAAGRESRLVLRLTSLDGRRVGIRNVRVLARVEGRGAVEAVSLVPWLPKDEPVEVSIRVRGHLVGAASLVVALTELSTEGTWVPVPTKVSNFSFSYVEPYTPPANRYILRSAVLDAEQVFGRDSQIKKVMDILRGASQLNPVLVLGARRIGKTSFLNAMCARPEVARDFIVVRVDFQNVPLNEPLATFFLTRMMRTVREHLPERMLVQIREEHVRENPHQAFVAFMEAVEHRLHAQDRRLLLVVDELDKIASAATPDDRGSRRDIGEEVLATLRAVMQRARRAGFVLAGATDRVRRYQSEYHSRLFQLAEEVELPPLDGESARELVRSQSKPALDWRKSALDFVVRETAGDPSLIQMLCFHVFSTLTERSARHVTVADVQETIASLVRHDTNFPAFAESVDDAVDRSVIRAIADLQVDATQRPGEARWCQRSWIVGELQRRGLAIDGEALAIRLERLCREVPNILTRNPNRPRRDFRIAAGLYARHLITHPARSSSRR